MVTRALSSSRLGQAVAWGAGAGVVASIFMGMYAMVASLIKGTGFFTPLHHIATLFADPADMMASMMDGMSGESSWELSAGTAILGLIIHMMAGAVYGAIFGAVVSQLKNVGAAVIAVTGLVYGGVVYLFSAFIGLPLAAAVLGVDDIAEGDMAGKNPIADMAEMAGHDVFIPEHLLFGLVLGLLLAARSSRRRDLLSDGLPA